MLVLDVGEGRAGVRLDAFLAGPLGSRAQAQQAIGAGTVFVDGAARPKSYQVSVGERVTVAAEDVEPAPDSGASPAPFGVAWEDEHLLVVDKPAGVVVHPGRGHREGTLAQALTARGAAGGEDGRAGIVHRLDRDTSGLLVVARSDEVHRRLKALIATRELRREYLALVLGRPPARSGTIDAPLGRDRRVRTRVSTETDAPRAARTHFEIEQALPSSTLLRVVLETGRTHQIRAHLQAIGHPVAGDPEYGGSGAFALPRQFLHATRLAFTHPVTGAPVDVTSRLPDDLADALDRAASTRSSPGR